MSRRKFVREIKAKDVKNLNPSDIIYLAMKDGSIILVSDDNDDLIDYDDLKLDTSYKRKHKYYNKKVTKSDDNNSLKTFKSDKNYKTNTYSNTSIDNKKASSTAHTTLNIVKEKPKVNTRMEKIKYKQNERMNKTINYNISTYQRKNDKLDKSFDSSQLPHNNIGFHSIEYINNNMNKSFDSYKIEPTYNDRSKSNIPNNKFFININDKRQRKDNINKFDYYQKYSNHLVNISDISFESNDNTISNRAYRLSKEQKYNNNYEINNNLSEKKSQLRSKSSIATNLKNDCVVQRKEVEILGRIVNDKNSYRNIDHHHPNTLFDPKCHYCQNLARENKISVSNIKTESIYDNYAFLATFGESGKKKGKGGNEYSRIKNYYL